MIQQALEEHFHIVSSAGDESIEELVLDCEPDIILLDVILENTNGYDICRRIRKLSMAHQVIIIFISSLHSLQDKLKAYEAGGDDYVCKPVNLTELQCKLDVYQKRINEQRQLSVQMEQISQANNDSQRHYNELNLLIECFKQTLSIDDLGDLYQASEVVLNAFGLQGCIEFRVYNCFHQYPQDNISHLESEILLLGKEAKAIVPLGANILFNSNHCSLLIKNMNSVDPDNQHLNDRLLTLVQIIDSRLLFLQSERYHLLERKKNIQALKTQIVISYGGISNGFSLLEQRLTQTFSQFQQDLNNKLAEFDASNSQTQQINTQVKQAKVQFDHIIKQSINIDYTVTDIDRLLNRIFNTNE
jgi:CheY-like chemotaxis protein